jgi:hypothetical protein
MEDNKLEELYEEYLSLTAKLVSKGVPTLGIAGVMMAQAMSMYKTALSPNEYDMIIDSISDSRDQVKRFDSGSMLQ